MSARWTEYEFQALDKTKCSLVYLYPPYHDKILALYEMEFQGKYFADPFSLVVFFENHQDAVRYKLLI